MGTIIDMLVAIILLYTALINLIDIKFTKKELIIMLCLTELIGVPAYVNLGYFSAIPINFITIIFLYKRSRNIVLSIILPLISNLIAVVADYILEYMEISIFGKVINISIMNLPKYILNFIIQIVIIFIISKFIGDLINKKITISKLKLKGKSAILIIISVILTFIIFYINIILEDKNKFCNATIKINSVLFCIYFMLLCVIVYFLIKSVTKELEMKGKQEQFKNLKEYTESLEKLYSDMRKFRHDYINIISSVLGYIEDRDMDGLEKYFSDDILPLSEKIKSNNFKLGLLKNIKVPELKGIMSSKIIRAQELGIDVFIDVAEQIQKVDITSIDLCRIVGILIDNAIEASLQCKKPSMKVAVVDNKNSIFIVVINNYNGDIPPIYKMFEKGFSTKGENRGLGLSNLKEIIEDYDNILLDTHAENSQFIQVVKIFNI